MRKLSAILLTMYVSGSFTPALAKNDNENKTDDKKHQLVDQIIDVVDEDNKRSDEELAELTKRQKQRMNRLIDIVADKTKMSADEKAKLKAKIAERNEEQHQLPPELKEKLEKRFDFKNFSRETAYQVLSDHLSDSDLKTILKFLKSPAGQKLFQEGPDMVGEVIELSAEKYLPILLDLFKDMKMPRNLAPTLPQNDSNTQEKRRQMMEKLKQLFKDNHLPQAPMLPGKDET